jgi:hypothetical protein
MLKTYGASRTAVAVAVAGLVVFCAVMGFAIYSWFEEQWPGVPFAWAVAVAILGPLLFLVAVGIVGATLDKLAGRTMSDEAASTPDSDAP